MKINYPKVTVPVIPDITDEGVLYWLHRVTELRLKLSDLYKKLFTYDQNHKITIGLLSSIIQREIEISNSIFLLITKNQIRDAGVLLLSIYELTLDIQYISVTDGAVSQWFNHENKKQKPWSISQKIKAIFPTVREQESEANFHKTYCMVKHGNIRGEYRSFNTYMIDDTLAMTETKTAAVIGTIYAMGYLIKRCFNAAMKILNDLGHSEPELSANMKKLSEDCLGDFQTFFQLKFIEIKYPGDPEKQEEIAKILNLRFSANSA